jgi:U3 small nucleolar RNA-associated protein MPP10
LFDSRGLVLSWFNFFFFFLVALESETTSCPHISELLSSLSPEEAPVTRSQTKALSGKRKRSPPKIAAFDQTPLTSLFIENAGLEQVWAQLELRAKGVCEMLTKALDGTLMDEDTGVQMLNGVDGGEDEDEDDNGGARKKLRFEDLSQEDIETLGVEPDVLKRLMESVEVEGDGEEELHDEESEDEDEDGEEFGEEVTSLRDPEILDSPGPSRSQRLSRRSKSSAGSQLDDGFFDLASFNAETEEAEASHVSRGRLKSLNDDEDSESDEESIDYFASVGGDPELDGGIDEAGAYLNSSVVVGISDPLSMQSPCMEISLIRFRVCRRRSHLQERRLARSDSMKRSRSRRSRHKGRDSPSIPLCIGGKKWTTRSLRDSEMRMEW